MGRFLATVGATTALTVAFLIGFVLDAMKYPDKFWGRYWLPILMIAVAVLGMIFDPKFRKGHRR